ncbi:MAG: anti-sigma regulatory factor [Halioglobus sp.]
MNSEIRRKIHSEMDVRNIVLETTLYSREMGFDDAPCQMISTAVSELVRNILKYAGSGEIHLQRVKKIGGKGIEIQVKDHGPGIADCEAAMRDHYSSGGTLGLGLPAVRRMMDDFLLESTPGEGTQVTVRKWL